MSTATSEAIILLEENFTQSCALVVGAGQSEVKLFWGERSFSAWLFFANRMLALVYASVSVRCMANFMTSNLVFTLIGLISGVVTVLRVYAVTGGDRRPVMLLTLITVLNVAFNVSIVFGLESSYSVIILAGMAMCSSSTTSSSAQDIGTKLETANSVCVIAASILSLAVLWRKLYINHKPATVDLLAARNPSLAALLLRDGTIQLTALLLLNLCITVLNFLDVSAQEIVGYLQTSLAPVLISRVLLNVRAAARSTRGEQSQTPSFVRSQHGPQRQADVENMSFELNILRSTEQAPESDRSHPQHSIEQDQFIAEPRSVSRNVVTAGGAHQDVNEKEGIDDVEEETRSDWEDDE
ncbi:uncharacterized protein LAESUDRAFT_482537 [Laetiporus sulphureus 93-53]|uniref:Uncharacterized protein n=1 Tax=Laetiporus sulphureus 93-53 TaxID=1314785 RepID=A0A165BNZ3_9APHY|nr:uncharacterized protein LAESUDRAFT_482537 [Laetiporus sulphureus 93-53]KZT01392.1 hypothetical protein LAESUDRAFT_482537 [Laetiporus sulphureus 93-53]